MDFRPISLCNVTYNVVMKIVANRIQPMLDGIIALVQGAFAPDRYILDNIISAKRNLTL